MKFKHVFWIVSAILAICGIAAAIVLLVDRFITNKECPDGYVDCGEEELVFED